MLFSNLEHVFLLIHVQEVFELGGSLLQYSSHEETVVYSPVLFSNLEHEFLLIHIQEVIELGGVGGGLGGTGLGGLGLDFFPLFRTITNTIVVIITIVPIDGINIFIIGFIL